MKLKQFLESAVRAGIVLAAVTTAPIVAPAQTIFTWDGGGSDNNWGTAANWVNDGAPSGDSGNTVLVFSGSTRTLANNSLSNWDPGVGQLYFAGDAQSFTLGGNSFGFRPYLGSGAQQIFQNSANTQTIGVDAFSFREASNSQINLNAGDLVISSANMYIDMNSNVFRTLTVTGNDATRRTLTFAGNVTRGNTESGNNDPDIVIQNNKRVLVTGVLDTGRGDDASVFIRDGVLEFGGAGVMTAGSPTIGFESGSANAAVMLNTAGSTFARQIEIKGGSSGQRIVGGVNTSGTVTFSGNMIASNAPATYDLKAAAGGAANFTGTRNFNAGLFVNRPDTATYGGTVILANTTNSDGFTAIHAGTLQISDFNQLGSAHFEFNADSGDSGTLRYTGGSTTTTKTLWIDNPGITRAAIDVTQSGTKLTWNPGDGNINQNLTKLGAGELTFGTSRLTDGATVRVEAGILSITGSNGYSGGTTVTGGTLLVSGGSGAGGSAAGLGTGAVSIGSGGRVTYYLSLDSQHTIANAFSLSGGTLFTEDGFNTFSGAVTLASGSSTIAARYEDTITLSGGLAGSGHVLFTQDGGAGGWAAPTYVLTGTGANTGTVRVSGSSGGGATKLQLASVNALQGATLDLASGDTGTVEFTVAGNNTYALGGLAGGRNLAFGSNSLSIGGNDQSTTYSGNLSGSGFLAKAGSGTLTLTGSNSYGGGTFVAAGRVVATTSQAFPGDVTNNAEVEFAVNGGSVSFGSIISGSGALIKSGTGELLLGAANTYSGGTVVTAGRLIADPAALQGAIANSGIVVLGSGSAGTFTGAVSGTGSVDVAGGNITFTAASTYTGATTVNNGARMAINGSLGNTAVTVLAGGTLGGTGTLGGNVLIQGVHAPGNSPGAQTFNADLTYAAGAIVNWELIANTTGSAGTNYDQIIVPTGNLAFSGATTLALAFGGTVDWANPFWDVNRSWMIYDLSGGTTTGLSNLTIGGSLLDSLGNSLSSTARGYFTTSLSGQDVMLNFVAVPEPSTWALALVGLAVGGSMLRQRRRKCV